MLGYGNSPQRLSDGAVQGAWWRVEEETGRLECLLCPRKCSLKAGDRGFCFVRENRDQAMVLTTYGRSTGFCIDPIEKKPLNHFYPGTAVLSFGTAGCNLGCKFCQNWDISKSREIERLSETAEPEAIAEAARQTGCKSVAFTYNDPVIWAEYAIDTARACHAVGVKTVAVTAGYIMPEARREFFEHMDAANVDLKAFTEEFYNKITYSHLEPVLDTLRFLKKETDVWFEITNLIIPDANDSPGDLRKMCDWILEAIGDDTPIHFTAFHPDFRMKDRPPTSPEVLIQAHEIARSVGLKFAYVGNVHDISRQSTYCSGCGELLIQRDWYQLGTYAIRLDEQTGQAECSRCGCQVPGRFQKEVGGWGSRRQPIRISDYAAAKPNQQVNHENALAGDPAKDLYQIKDDSVTSTNAGTSDSTAVPPSAVPPKPLNLASITAEQKQLVLSLAVGGVASTVTGQPVKTPPEALEDFSKSIVMGAFVTLKRGEVLRGCCGVLGKPMAVGPAISSAAVRTAKDDQRMAPISPSELPFLDIDVSLLGPFKKIDKEGAARAEAVKVGKHGLMIQRGKHNGLLLPSVATERGWDATRFLQAVCTKARLPIDAWESPDSEVMTFDGQAISGRMKDLLPINMPNTVDLQLGAEQVSAYAQVAGQNIVAIATGGTPSYVIPQLPDVNVNALVLSMQWESEKDAEKDAADKHQGNAIQISFRPGVPLQSTLFQMCQNAAALFQRQHFSGQLQVGLTVGFDPAMHGYGYLADLEGVETDKRAVIISDPRHCGLAFDPSKTADELREALRKNLPVNSRDGMVHTVHVVSTMPHVMSVTMPTPVTSTGARAPAVAGKFYPAEDAARRALVGKLFKGEDPAKCSPLAIMVPHAGLKYSGKVAAEVWRRLDNLANRNLIIISPKHTGGGVNWSVCPFDSWRLSATTAIEGDSALASEIAEQVTELQLDASAHALEHGIEVQLPLLERVAPSAKVVGIALHGGSWEDLEEAASQMADVIRNMETPPLLVISSDMNHYAPDAENRRRDRLALDALASCDPQTLIATCRENEISMCGMVPAAFVMETLRKLGKSFRVEEVDYATSADVTGDKSQVVGYAGALLLED